MILPPTWIMIIIGILLSIASCYSAMGWFNHHVAMVGCIDHHNADSVNPHCEVDWME